MEPMTFSESDEDLAALGYSRVTFAADQPEYLPLPALVHAGADRRVLTRWRPSEDERRAIMDGAAIELAQLTFGHPLQPLLVGVQGVAYDAGELGSRARSG